MAPNAVQMSCLLPLALFLAVGGAGQQPPPRDRPAPAAVQGTGAIAGRVTIMDTKPAAPVRRARITLTSPVLSAPLTTDTDTSGRYQFAHLPPGPYRLTAAKPGFVTLPFGAARAADRPAPIELTTVAVTANLALPRGAAIEGRLVGEDGDPVQNVVVSVVRFVHGPAGRRRVVAAQARTDDLGRYRVHSLPAGEYFVDAAPDPVQAVVESFDPRARPPRLVRTYLPGTPRVLEARRVSLAAGQELQGADFALGAVPVAQVTGQVLNSLGAPAAVRGVRLQEIGAAPGDVVGLLTQTNRFMFRSVPPGDYWLLATVVPAGGDPEFAALRVTVAGQDLTGLTVTTAKGAVLDGAIESEDGAAIPAGLRLVALETDFDLPGGTQPVPAAETPIGSGGRFTVNGLFGARILRVSGLPSNVALKTVSLDGADVTDAAVDFKAGATSRSLRVVITGRTASVRGTVTNSRNRPAVNATVIAFPEDERQWGATSRSVKVASVAADGRFEIDGLLPGKFFVAALDAMEEGAWNDPDFLRRLRATAASLSLAASDAQTVALRARSGS